VIEILPSPIAIGFFCFQKEHYDKSIIVIDFGSSHLCVAHCSIKSGWLEVKCNSLLIGGEKFTEALKRKIEQDFKDRKGEVFITERNTLKLEVLCEKKKIALSECNRVYMEIDSFGGIDQDLVADVSTTQLDSICYELTKQCTAFIDEQLAQFQMEDINAVVAVGGSIRLPFINNYLKGKFGTKLCCSVDTNETACLGAATIASAKYLNNQTLQSINYKNNISLSEIQLLVDNANLQELFSQEQLFQQRQAEERRKQSDLDDFVRFLEKNRKELERCVPERVMQWDEQVRMPQQLSIQIIQSLFDEAETSIQVD